ncbi:MAG: ribonuclease HII [Saprospiraceae bacterium]
MLQSALTPDQIEAGCDEAGRGCLAGPVYAAAVILPKDFAHPLLNDSKQLTEKQRLAARPIIEAEALAWAVTPVPPTEIDEVNILNASYLAMHRSVAQLKIRPELLLIDGNRFKPFEDIPFECIIKGDGKYMSIAAASILAKTYRDEYMAKIGEAYPVYQWKKNKGYPTKVHRDAIRQHGATPHHRRSFRLLPFPEQLPLFVYFGLSFLFQIL